MVMDDVKIYSSNPEAIRRFIERIVPEEHHNEFKEIYFRRELGYKKLSPLGSGMALPGRKLLLHPSVEYDILNPQSQSQIDNAVSTVLHEYGHYAFYSLSGKRAGEWREWYNKEILPTESEYLRRSYGDNKLYMEGFADAYMFANHPDKAYREEYFKKESKLIKKYKEMKSGAWSWAGMVKREWKDKPSIEGYENWFIKTMPIKPTRILSGKTFLLKAGHLTKEDAERWVNVEKKSWRRNKVRVISYKENDKTRYAIYEWNRWIKEDIKNIPKKLLRRGRKAIPISKMKVI